MSNCDSELIAVYLADRMQQGADQFLALDSDDGLEGIIASLHSPQGIGG